jgi:hypothetical protein
MEEVDGDQTGKTGIFIFLFSSFGLFFFFSVKVVGNLKKKLSKIEFVLLTKSAPRLKFELKNRALFNFENSVN